MRLVIISLLLPLGLSIGTASAAPSTPCELWVGSASGNDAAVSLTIRLCRQGRRVTGKVFWSSRVSGSNVRAVAGSWSADGKTLTMSDQRVLESAPRPGWVFCPIDRYVLRPTKRGGLTGRYRSTACRDTARMQLKRQAL